jgi:hypothetical protein
VPDGVSRYRTSGVQNGFVAAHATFPPFASI